MSRAVEFLMRRRGGERWHWTDVFTWFWLAGGLVMMFGPALWLVNSSFKTPAALAEFLDLLAEKVAKQMQPHRTARIEVRVEDVYWIGVDG